MGLTAWGLPTIDLAHVDWLEASSAQNNMAAVSADGGSIEGLEFKSFLQRWAIGLFLATMVRRDVL